MTRHVETCSCSRNQLAPVENGLKSRKQVLHSNLRLLKAGQIQVPSFKYFNLLSCVPHNQSLIPWAPALEMLARSCAVRALRQSSCLKRGLHHRFVSRSYSGASKTASDASSAAAHPLLGVASELDNVAPRFEIDPSKISILNSPSAFYEAVKV